jgi:ubiquitin thioesterase OTU1
MALKIRYRAPSGGGTLDLDENATVRQLFDAIKEKTGSGEVTIKYGWPPKALAADQADLSLVSLNLQRENLTVIPAERAPSPSPATAQPAAPAPAIPADLYDAPSNVNDKPVTLLMPTGTYLGELILQCRCCHGGTKS